MIISLRRRRLLLALATAFLGVTFVFLTSNNNQPQRSPELVQDNGGVEYIASSAEQVIVEKPACILPTIFPDRSWLPTSIKPFSCSSYYDNPVSIDNEFVVAPDESSNVTCQYRSFTFLNDFDVRFADVFIPLPPGRSPCPTELFIVQCGLVEGEKTTMFFSAGQRCIFKKPEVTKRLSHSKSAKPPTASTILFKDRLNILIFLLDSVSRVAWLEQMEKTTEFITKNLDTAIFEGHNIVGDGTLAQVLAFTTGFYEEELEEKFHEARRGFDGAKKIDDYPFVWRQLANDSDYVTLFDEDSHFISTFQLRFVGFEKPPVDYYGRPFQLVQGSSRCIGSMPAISELISLPRQLFRAYPDPVRKFSFVFSNSFTHTEQSDGTQLAYWIDELLADELKLLQKNGHLNESVLILMADHGSRFNGSRATLRGKIAERLPYLSMSFPSWFQQKYPKEMANLKKASKGLTTHFDLHATLLDIGGVRPIAGTPKRGISFFAERALNRTCKDAEIMPHWCTCLLSDGASSDLPLSDPLVAKALHTFDEFVNENLLSRFLNDTCHRLTAGQPFAARRLLLNKDVTAFVGTVDDRGLTPSFNESLTLNEDYLQVSFRTTPGDGEWEVTFLHSKDLDSLRIDSKQISRTNRYGSASKCIQDKFPQLREFCYCHDKQHLS